MFLTLTMPNFLNEIILLTFLALSIISFRDIKMKTWRWSANCTFAKWWVNHLREEMSVRVKCPGRKWFGSEISVIRFCIVHTLSDHCAFLLFFLYDRRYNFFNNRFDYGLAVRFCCLFYLEIHLSNIPKSVLTLLDQMKFRNKTFFHNFICSTPTVHKLKLIHLHEHFIIVSLHHYWF